MPSLMNGNLETRVGTTGSTTVNIAKGGNAVTSVGASGSASGNGTMHGMTGTGVGTARKASGNIANLIRKDHKVDWKPRKRTSSREGVTSGSDISK